MDIKNNTYNYVSLVQISLLLIYVINIYHRNQQLEILP